MQRKSAAHVLYYSEITIVFSEKVLATLRDAAGKDLSHICIDKYCFFVKGFRKITYFDYLASFIHLEDIHMNVTSEIDMKDKIADGR